MGRRKRIRTKRCVVCRRKYRPHVSVEATQKTCSAECRVARRKRSTKAWREASLDGYREFERKRQKRHRAISKGVRGGSVDAAQASMSRTGLFLEVSELKDLMEEIGDKVEAMSRTWLAEKVRLLSGARAEKRGQEGTELTGCHGPG
jgi:hypothetical protein